MTAEVSSHDDVMVAAIDAYGALWSILPPGFLGARLTLEPSDDGLRVSDLRATLSKPPEEVARPVTPEYQLGLVGLKLSELREALVDIDVAWDGSRVECERGDGPVRLRLFDRDAEEEAVCGIVLRDEDLARCLFSDQLFARVAERRESWRARQRTFEEAIGKPDDLQLDLTVRRCRFVYGADRPPVERPIRLLGTYAREHGSWQWAWANASLPPALHEGLTSFRDRVAQEAGMAALVRPGFDCHPDFASHLAALAADELGAVALINMIEEQGGRTAMVAVLPETPAAP